MRPPQPSEWWVAQAAKVGGKCLKCRAETVGVYVPPTRDTHWECAIVEHCRVCGWETCMVRGQVRTVEAVHTRPLQLVQPQVLASTHRPGRGRATYRGAQVPGESRRKRRTPRKNFYDSL